jgi:hypothetical protein
VHSECSRFRFKALVIFLTFKAISEVDFELPMGTSAFEIDTA